MEIFKIDRISVKNFKSLADFEISDIPMFSCLIGINGSGKTTLLQFLDFVKSLMNGNVHQWVNEQGLNNVTELLTLGGERKYSIDIEIDATLGEKKASWKAKFNTREMRCTVETLKEGVVEYRYESGKLSISEPSKKIQVIDYGPSNYSGSIFSFRETGFSKFIRQCRFLGVLDPHAIAQSSRVAKAQSVSVESNGRNLSGFIAGLSADNQRNLLAQIQNFYAPLKAMEIKRQQFGWKSLLLSELEKSVFSATNLSYGTLRLFVLLSQQFTDDKVILFDEVENGLNQELFEKFVAKLQNYGEPKKQVIVSTHSGLFLNYLTDEQARSGVFFLYKDKLGHTCVRRFFDIPQMSEKLNVLGPGEAMGDTDLMELSDQLSD
ncbi:MAG: AAA family ATPase [Fibrobacter sp.]|nr:AAA family ATPase [Fibrobacter sp.]